MGAVTEVIRGVERARQRRWWNPVASRNESGSLSGLHVLFVYDVPRPRNVKRSIKFR